MDSQFVNVATGKRERGMQLSLQNIQTQVQIVEDGISTP